MSSFLDKNGFVLDSTCACGGDPKETWVRYGKPSIFVEIRKQRDFFRVTSVYPPVKGTLAEMEAKLKELLRHCP